MWYNVIYMFDKNNANFLGFDMKFDLIFPEWEWIAHILMFLFTELFQKKDASLKRKKSGGKPPRKKFKKTDW